MPYYECLSGKLQTMETSNFVLMVVARFAGKAGCRNSIAR